MTLLWAILIVLVTSCTVQAGEREGWPTSPSVEYPGPLMLCNKYSECEPSKEILHKLACYQRMQKAMQAAEKYKEEFWLQLSPHANTHAFANTYYNQARCITVACLQKELDEAKAREKETKNLEQAKKHWDTTMKECVP